MIEILIGVLIVSVFFNYMFYKMYTSARKESVDWFDRYARCSKQFEKLSKRTSE